MTNINRVGIAYIEYHDIPGRGKRRPILVFGTFSDGKTKRAFKITSQFDKKSQHIRQNYYAIKDWRGCGLRKPSWVDLNNWLNADDLPDIVWVGHLRYDDVIELSKKLIQIQQWN